MLYACLHLPVSVPTPGLDDTLPATPATPAAKSKRTSPARTYLSRYPSRARSGRPHGLVGADAPACGTPWQLLPANTHASGCTKTLVPSSEFLQVTLPRREKIRRNREVRGVKGGCVQKGGCGHCSCCYPKVHDGSPRVAVLGKPSRVRPLCKWNLPTIVHHIRPLFHEDPLRNKKSLHGPYASPAGICSLYD